MIPPYTVVMKPKGLDIPGPSGRISGHFANLSLAVMTGFADALSGGVAHNETVYREVEAVGLAHHQSKAQS